MTTPTIVDFAAAELGVSLHAGQADALSGYYASGRPNWLLLAGRRGGKSLLSDVIACYEAVVPDFAGYLRPGEDRYVIVTSVRQDAANQHIRQIGRLLRHTRALGRLVRDESRDRLTLRNGVVILSLPASARAGRGWTASTLVFDELAHYVDTQGNASADAVYDAFSPAVATFGDAARIVITTTPAARAGIVYDLYDRSQAGELADFYVTKAPTRDLNPRVSERTIDRARARDAESAAVEYDAEFREPIEAFLSGEAIDRAIDKRPGRIQADPAHTYAMAVDPAVMQDRYAYLIGHREGERIIVDHASLLHPPIDPAAAEALLLDLARRFRPTVIRTGSAALVHRLGRELPALRYEPFTRPRKLQWYGAVKEALNLGRLSLPKQDDLLAELRALQIRNGVDIGHPKSGAVKHDDLADCLALVADSLAAEVGHQTFSLSYTHDRPRAPFKMWYTID